MPMPARLPFLAAATLVASLALAASAHAVTIDFSDSQYADNFTETANGSLMGVSGDALVLSNSSSASGIAVYNDPFPAAGVGDFTLSADAKFGTLATNTFNGNSVGFMTNLSAVSGGSGFVTVFRTRTLSGVSQADLRVFNVTSSGTVGAQIGSTVVLNAAALATTFASDTFYTFQLDVDTGTAGTISFTGTILDANTSSVIGAFPTISSTYTSGSEPTYVGLRLGTQGQTPTTVDNFVLSSSAVPEPSSAAALGGLAALGCVALRRRRRR